MSYMVLSLFALVFLGVIAVMVAIGLFVYKDAEKRGMNKWLWVFIAIFTPNLIGVIIYLVVRSETRLNCPECKNPIEKVFEACPYCGYQLDKNCSQCKHPVMKDWKVCPYCKNKL